MVNSHMHRHGTVDLPFHIEQK